MVALSSAIVSDGRIEANPDSPREDAANMPSELDHFFICVAASAPECERLIEFGLAEGSPNRHPGQGTANRRFFFHNASLELLWVEAPVEAQSDLVRRTGLWERWSHRGSGASPFGVGLRPGPKAVNEAPFPAWDYRPPYLPDPLAIQMAISSEAAALPLLFYLPFGRRPDPNDVSRRQPRDHAVAMRDVTRLRIGIATASIISPELQAAREHCNSLEFAAAPTNLMEVGFDGETAGRSVDFRPELPLVLRW
jgi:hypothetical protein